MWFTGTVHRLTGFDTVQMYILYFYITPTHHRKLYASFEQQKQHCLCFLRHLVYEDTGSVNYVYIVIPMSLL